MDGIVCHDFRIQLNCFLFYFERFILVCHVLLLSLSTFLPVFPMLYSVCTWFTFCMSLFLLVQVFIDFPACLSACGSFFASNITLLTFICFPFPSGQSYKSSGWHLPLRSLDTLLVHIKVGVLNANWPKGDVSHWEWPVTKWCITSKQIHVAWQSFAERHIHTRLPLLCWITLQYLRVWMAVVFTSERFST